MDCDDQNRNMPHVSCRVCCANDSIRVQQKVEARETCCCVKELLRGIVFDFYHSISFCVSME